MLEPMSAERLEQIKALLLTCRDPRQWHHTRNGQEWSMIPYEWQDFMDVAPLLIAEIERLHFWLQNIARCRDGGSAIAYARCFCRSLGIEDYENA